MVRERTPRCANLWHQDRNIRPTEHYFIDALSPCSRGLPPGSTIATLTFGRRIPSYAMENTVPPSNSQTGPQSDTRPDQDSGGQHIDNDAGIGNGVAEQQGRENQEPEVGAQDAENDSQASDSGEEEESGDEDEELAPSFVHATRKSKTKAEREARKGKKAGNPGRFKPEINEFLGDYLDVYASVYKPGRGKVKGLEDFWHMVRSGFWRKFDWNDARIGMTNDGAGLTQLQVMTATNDVRRGFLR